MSMLIEVNVTHRLDVYTTRTGAALYGPALASAISKVIRFTRVINILK
jgi:hypothetical protein